MSEKSYDSNCPGEYLGQFFSACQMNVVSLNICFQS